jgi:hypothetical protein
MKCRSVVDNKGGAAGDRIDRDHKNQKQIKNYKNFENQFSNDEMDSIFHDRQTVIGNHTNEYSSEIIRSFEEKEQLTKQKKKNKLEELMIDNKIMETQDELEA